MKPGKGERTERSDQEAELKQQKLFVTPLLDCHMIHHSLTRRRAYHALLVGLFKKALLLIPISVHT